MDITIWYSVQYSLKGENDWYPFDDSMDSDTLEVIKLILADRSQKRLKHDPEVFNMYEFRIVRKELTEVVMEE